MRSLLLLVVLATASQAYMVPQNAPCSGSTVCLINCVLDSRCPVFNLAKPVFLAGTSCSRFFKCESGRACEMECPVGLHFNLAKEACDWPNQACCDPSIECRPDPCRPGSGCDTPIVPVPPAPIVPLPPRSRPPFPCHRAAAVRSV
ncbi:AGAP005975-PA-like protein [Anopheles sinensis]|uniref:AGAP005975-PA-like protein n=1 Tax=Anopheles sinensis TaxID=74873 RepID=A0A084W0Y0_ANOSI|nr:AGAP005975-PA-like protein [Anopheles sinensis]